MPMGYESMLPGSQTVECGHQLFTLYYIDPSISTDKWHWDNKPTFITINIEQYLDHDSWKVPERDLSKSNDLLLPGTNNWIDYIETTMVEFPKNLPGEDFINSWYPILIALVCGLIYGLRWEINMKKSLIRSRSTAWLDSTLQNHDLAQPASDIRLLDHFQIA